jgi:hypothetical protein
MKFPRFFKFFGFLIFVFGSLNWQFALEWDGFLDWLFCSDSFWEFIAGLLDEFK